MEKGAASGRQGHPGRRAVDPFQDRQPLLQVFFDLARRHVPQRQPMRSQMHVVLRVSQMAEHRQAQGVQKAPELVGRAGARIDPDSGGLQMDQITPGLQTSANAKIGSPKG